MTLRPSSLSLAVLVLLPGLLGAQQVDFIWTNASGTDPAEYHDGIVLYDSFGASQRPLAQLIDGTSTDPLSTGSVVSEPYHLNLGGVDYLYFFDNIVDTLFRGTDSNMNGVIDPTEFVPLWDIRTTGNISPDTVRYHNGKWVLSNDLDALGSSTRGIWVLDDLNGDADYYDAGESTQVLNGGTSGATFLVNGVIMSSDDIDAADWLANGDVIFYEDDDRIWYRYDSQTQAISTYLVYQTSTGASTMQTPNPDFVGGSLPGTTLDLCRVTIDYTTTPETVYLGVDYSASQPHIFAAQDFNADGDINDAGEVRLFYHGVNGALPTWLTDEMKWFNGSLYVCGERNLLSSSNIRGNEFVRLTDLDMNGDAFGLGEQTLLLSFPDGMDDPQMLGMTVVPAGTFGLSCVGAHISTSGISSAGGTTTFDFTNIPASGVGGTAIVGLSLTGDSLLPVGAGCGAGLTYDVLTDFLLTVFPAAFTTPVITPGAATGFNNATTPGFPVPPGAVPPGLTFFYAGVVIEPGGTFTATQSRTTVSQ